MTILITGGAGFIGSHLVRHLVKNYPDYFLVNLDALTYAADLSRLDDVNNAPNYHFIEGSINDVTIIDRLFSTHSIESVINLAAESHVDRSIENPLHFTETNIVGTMNLLNACRAHWKKEQIIDSIKSAPMKSMGLWEKKVPLRNKVLINRDLLMQPLKQVQIIWSVPLEKPMDCHI